MPVTAPLHGVSARLRRRTTAAAVGLVAAAVTSVGLVATPPAEAAARTFAEALAQLRQCESSGNYAINTGNGYYGAYQFNASTWRSVGGAGLPHQNPPHVQDEMATRLYEQRGWQPWPTCSRKLALPRFDNPRQSGPQAQAVVAPQPPPPPPPPPPFDGETRRVAHAEPAPVETESDQTTAEPTAEPSPDATSEPTQDDGAEPTADASDGETSDEAPEGAAAS